MKVLALEYPVWVVLRTWVSTMGVLLAQAEWVFAQAPRFYLSIKLVLFAAKG
jgi:hypothetical protein